MRIVAPRPHWVAAVAAGLALVVVAVTWMFHARRVNVPYFTWAKAQGWDVQTVRVVYLRPPWLTRFEPVPPLISLQEFGTVSACQGTPGNHSTVKYHDNTGSTVALRQLYERTVAKYPNAFYPEYCLADWYAGHKNVSQYHYWEQRALHHAPAILAGRVEYDDGRPVADARVQLILSAFEIDQRGGIYRIGWYPQAVTDNEGCYYVPVFKGVYAMEGPGLYSGDALTDGHGNHLDLVLTGGETSDLYGPASSGKATRGMVAVSHVGVLPKIIARPKIQITSPAGQATNNEQHPALITSKVLDLAWETVPGAVRYTAQLDRHDAGSNANGETVFPNNPLFWSGSSGTHLRLPLDGADSVYGGNSPLFQKNSIYTLTIYAHSSTDPGARDLVDTSSEFYFRPLSADAPQPLTKANVARVIGPGAVVTAIEVRQNGVVVVGSAPRGTLNKLAAGRREVGDFFGLQSGAEFYSDANAQDRQQFRMAFKKP